VLDAHLAQVDRLNPVVNAVVTLVADEARERARFADERYAAGELLGPLHGIPMAHKDTHRTRGIRTTFGSRTLSNFVPSADDLIIERLRGAGAITFGKTNVPEFAAGSHTFNEVFGSTRNPFDPSRSAGGSSGGAAAGLACGFFPLADGSDMGGSLRNPASFCNVVGLRSTAGRVPTYPAQLPFARMSVPGGMARSVADLALMMSVIAGPDRRAPLSLESPGARFLDDLARERPGLRVAWAPDLNGQIAVDLGVRQALSDCPSVFEQLGWSVEEAAPDLSGADEVFRVLRAFQFELSLGAARDAHPDLFKASLSSNIDVGRSLTGPEVARAEQHQGVILERILGFFERFDLLALPVSQVLPFPVEIEYPERVGDQPVADYIGWMASCYLISVTGLPAMSVPAGFSPEGLPVGVQLVGPPRGDVELMAAAYAFEQATRFGERRPPIVGPGDPVDLR
jgi:amidase